MLGELHQLTAAVYLGAALAAALGLALPSARASRVGTSGLAVGAVLHSVAFYGFHDLDPTPSLITLPAAISLSSWMVVIFFLVMGRRRRLQGLGALVATVAFLGVFWSSILLPQGPAHVAGAGAFWSHLHILLASAGLSSLALAGLAGALYLIEHRRLKAKLAARSFLPPLEALDRVNIVALAIGFPLLTAGVISGMLWVNVTSGNWWPGSPHANWSALAWGVYSVLLIGRFALHQGARTAAVQAVGGFAFLLFVVVGV